MKEPRRILVIGGTRLLGLALVKRLISMKCDVTVISRHAERCPVGIECIMADRNLGISSLKGRKFSLTLDFIAYNEQGPREVFNALDPGVYILISSIWMVRILNHVKADDVISSMDPSCLSHLPAVTSAYLAGKMRAEAVVMAYRENNGTATVLRLPVFWGLAEHTGRLGFYLQRVSDGGSVICVDGGYNIAQIAWTEDLARVIASWLQHAQQRPIWEGIPDQGMKVCEIISHLAHGMGKTARLVNLSLEKLKKELPEYLESEPLWREKAVDITDSNIFKDQQDSSTSPSLWLRDLALNESGAVTTELRQKERLLLGRLGYA